MLPIHILEGLAACCIIFLSSGSLFAESEPACPVGWIPFSSRCYFVVQTLHFWQAGRETCRDMGARIIEITSDEENKFIVDLVGDVTFTSEDKAWLDCTNVGRSLNDWVCGADDHELSYENWKSKEPNNFAEENCMEIYSSGVWNDKECTQHSRLTICEKPACPVGWIPFSSRCYFVVQTLHFWQAGRETCRDMGARIIEITSDEENKFIVDLVGDVTFTSEDKAWLDCTNVGRSLNDWVCGADDHELSYENWKSKEPNNFAEENCMEIYSSGVWNDKECTQHSRLTICEKSSPAQSISKSILMKRDGSWPPRCLHNHVIDTIQSASLVECVSRCLATTGESCLSINHFDGSRVCQLNGASEVTASGDFLETKDCKYFRIVV